MKVVISQYLQDILPRFKFRSTEAQQKVLTDYIKIEDWKNTAQYLEEIHKDNLQVILYHDSKEKQIIKNWPSYILSRIKTTQIITPRNKKNYDRY